MNQTDTPEPEFIFIRDEQTGKYEGTTDVFYKSEKGSFVLGQIKETMHGKDKGTLQVFDVDDNPLLPPTRDGWKIRRYFEKNAETLSEKWQKREKETEEKEKLSAHKKTKHMNTQKEKPKNEKPDSRIYIVEQGTWKNGKEVLTFYYKNEEGKPKAVAHSFVYYDKQGQFFRTQDAKGNEIFPECANRYDLKKYALDNEQELIQKFEKSQELEKNPVQQNARINQAEQKSVNNSEQVQRQNPDPEKKQTKERTSHRRNELKEIRRDKDTNEKDQTISH